MLVFVAGVIALAYPYIAEWWNSRVETKAYAEYNEMLRNFDQSAVKEFFKRADEYNTALQRSSNRFSPTSDMTNWYNDVLDTSGTGIICYVEIPKIDIRLPVYHGTGEGVLQVAVGHFEGSSLPTGQLGTHAVLSGHNGLMSSAIFTNLDRLELGDMFYVTVLGNRLDYVVDEINVVLPDNLDYFGISSTKNYVTLVTCTPFGVNDHRLLVRGSRIDYGDGVNRLKIRF